MTQSDRLKSLVILLFFVSSVASVNFPACLEDFKNGTNSGGVGYNGAPVPSKDAVGMTYDACRQHCGRGQEAFNWTVFSQQFSAWLLPWLALVSQLPFGAESRLDNLISGKSFFQPSIGLLCRLPYHCATVVLTVGSPTLASFSLVLTALNTRWANDRFSAIQYPNSRNAVKALIYLQQVPLRLTTIDGLLPSLVVLPENDDWWESLVDRLEQTHTWSIAAATSIIWVVIAFVFTIVDSFMNLGNNINSNGQAVGSLWLWLIPIVVGWLWIPVCSYDKLKTAIDKANQLAYIAAPDSPPKVNGSPAHTDAPSRVSDVSHRQAVRIYKKKKVFTQDAARVAPVFNYARVWAWSTAVETIAQAFDHADKKARKREPVNFRKVWVHPEEKARTNRRDNRTGTIGQVQMYCGFPVGRNAPPTEPTPSGVWKRIFVASAFALGLQWATTSSAALIVVFTPTSGLGCRSGSYILYGIVSTMIWAALLLSSCLADYAKARYDRHRSGFNSVSLAKGLATFLRRLATFAAYCNSIGVILACVFQFSNFFSTCYCNSSVLGRGAANAYNIIGTGFDHNPMKGGWIGALVLASGSVVLFLFFLHLILELPHNTINS